MPAPCSWCTHPRRGEIERRVADGWSYRQVVETFGGSIPSASRHFRLGHPADRPMTPEQLAQPHGIAIPAGALDSIRRPEVSEPAQRTTAPDASEAESGAVGVSRSRSPAGSLREECAVLVSRADQLAVDDLAGAALDEARELLSALADLLAPQVESSDSGSPAEAVDMSEPGTTLPVFLSQPRVEEPVVAASESAAPPTRVHFVGAVLLHQESHSVFGDSRSYGYGDELEVTPGLLLANDDRNGESWFRTWFEGGEPSCWRGGTEVVRRGPWPAGTSRLEPGSSAWSNARVTSVVPG